MDEKIAKKIEDIKSKIKEFHEDGARTLEVTFYIELAGVYLQENEIENANDCFKIAVEIDKDLSRDNKAYIFRKIAQKYYDAQYLKEALACFKKAMDLCKTQNNIPGVCYHAYNIGKCYYDMENKSEGDLYLGIIEEVVKKCRYDLMKENKFSQFKVCLCTLRDAYLLQENIEKAEEADHQRELVSKLEDDQWANDRETQKSMKNFK